MQQIKIYFERKNTISANHSNEDQEILYLIRGEIELTVGKERKKVSAPIRIDIPPNTYHKLVALSDIELLEDRSGE